MHIRTRKFIGTVLMIILVLCWALFFMAVAQGRVMHAGAVVQLIYYIVAGVGWVIPAGLIIKWMSRPD